MRIAIPFLLALTVGACGVEDPADDSTGLKSQAGHFEATANFEPSPPAVGKNRLELELRNEDGSFLEAAKLEAEPWMPAHGHGVPVRPSVKEMGAGVYSVEDLRFTMPGTWEVKVQIQAGQVDDSLVVKTDVQ